MLTVSRGIAVQYDAELKQRVDALGTHAFSEMDLFGIVARQFAAELS
jgi:hypothetical protein